MSFAKAAQVSLDGMDVVLPPPEDSNDVMFVDGDPPEGEVILEMDSTPDVTLDFTLDRVPGALDQEDIVDENDLMVEEEEIDVSDDPWKWTLSGFLPWLSHKMQSCPIHSGKDIGGLERIIAYFEELDRHISKAMKMDLNNELDWDTVDKAREEIHMGLDRLTDRLERIKKKKQPKRKAKKASEEEAVLVKEAQKATAIRGIVVSVPLFIAHCASVCINGMVSAGHDIEDMFKKISKKHNLSKREQAELLQLLSDMNYPVRRDRGLLLDEEFDGTSSDNFDYAANYHA